jgi:type II secretory pathway pseudopilin PulG
MGRTGHGTAGGGGAGFSIVEMMFVIVIIMVLATVSVPTFMGVSANDRVVQATGEIQRAFELARSRAILKNAAVRITIHRNPGDARPNVRVDESPDSSCTGFARIATRTVNPDPSEAGVDSLCTTWLAVEQPRCGVVQVEITGTNAWGGYKESSVVITGIAEGSSASGSWTTYDDVVLCVNRRGRMLRQSGTDWIPVTGGIRFQLDRLRGGSPLGVTKSIFIPQGGVSGVIR